MKVLEILVRLLDIEHSLTCDICGIEEIRDAYETVGKARTLLTQLIEELEAIAGFCEDPQQVKNLIEFAERIMNEEVTDSTIGPWAHELRELVMDIVKLTPWILFVDVDFRKDFLIPLKYLPDDYLELVRDLVLEACRCYEASSFQACVFQASKALEILLRKVLANSDLSAIEDSEIKDSVNKLRKGTATFGDLVRIAIRSGILSEKDVLNLELLLKIVKDIRNVTAHEIVQLDESKTKRVCFLISELMKEIGSKLGNKNSTK